MKKIKDMLNNARNSDAYWFGRVKLHVSTQLQDMLKASGINQGQYAEALGVKPPMVSRLINGQGNPTLETLVKAGRVLGYVPRVTFVPAAAFHQNGVEEGAASSVFMDIEQSDVKPSARLYHFPVQRQPVQGRVEVHGHEYQMCSNGV